MRFNAGIPVLITVAAVMFFGLLVGTPVQGSTISGFAEEYYDLDYHQLVRVLPDTSGRSAWIITNSNHLTRLDQMSDGEIRITNIPIGYGVIDGAGPDSAGKIYFIGGDAEGNIGVVVFNTITLENEGLYPLELTGMYKSLIMSDDQTKLYFTTENWPESEREGHWNVNDPAPDTGELLEIDIESMAITRDVTVGQASDVYGPGGEIYYSQNWTIFVNTVQVVPIETETEFRYRQPSGTYVDVIDLITFSTTKRIISGLSAAGFFTWSDDGSLVAQANMMLDMVPDRLEYLDGILIFDTESSELVDSFAIMDEEGTMYGGITGIVSELDPDIVYVSAMGQFNEENPLYDPSDALYNFIALDKTTGEVIAGLNLYDIATILHEMADGTIIALGMTSQIAVIRPVYQ